VETVLVEYVKGPPPDRWHWCKNCSQYPLEVYKRRLRRPEHDLCDECKAKENNKSCTV
jgi:hypothetical protein